MVRNRKFSLYIAFSIIGILHAFSQKKVVAYEILKVNKSVSEGFSYPYLLYIPNSLTKSEKRSDITLLVVPNNTGTVNDTLQFHEAVARKQLLIWAKFANRLNTAVLMPIFPRPKKDVLVYTHALDRDVMISEKEEFKRLDLQLIAMIDHSTKELAGRNIKKKKKVWMAGFSASGMFVNRFTFMHPGQVEAAAIGSPGGWPIAPIGQFQNESLRYPIGISDISSIAGEKINFQKLQKTPLFIYMGDEDHNDSVVYADGYEKEDKELIFELFGETPLERWNLIQDFYQQEKLQASFKLYPGVKHTINNDMIADVVSFFNANN